MTKKELIDAVYEAAQNKGIEITKKDTATLVGEVFTQSTAALEDEGRFSYPGFGTFTIKERAARTGRNPRTGEPMEIAASTTVKFKPAPLLKEAVN